MATQADAYNAKLIYYLPSTKYNLKQEMVEEELDETAYWLELIMELRLVKPELLGGLYAENKELVRIIVKSILTMRTKINGTSEIVK